MDLLELSGVCNEQMLNFILLWLQFQGLGKYKTIYVFVSQHVFGNNKRNKLADCCFRCFYRFSINFKP